jgi:thymidine phosphorylase
VRTVAFVTDMDTPLGEACGNGVEVAESVATLQGRGPADLVELVVTLAREMLALAGLDVIDPAAALADGQAMAVWEAMIRAQGGDPDAPLAEAPIEHIVPAPASGYVQRLDARAVGVAVWRLGAGRSRKDDAVSATAGALCQRKPGDPVDEGEPVLVLSADDPARLPAALAALDGAIEIGPEPPPPRPLIVERIG